MIPVVVCHRGCLIDDAGHVPWFEDPSRVAREVRRFLAA